MPLSCQGPGVYEHIDDHIDQGMYDVHLVLREGSLDIILTLVCEDTNL